MCDVLCGNGINDDIMYYYVYVNDNILCVCVCMYVAFYE